MSRRELRDQIFKLLFRIEFNEAEEMPAQVQLFFETKDEDDKAIAVMDQAEIQVKYDRIGEKLSEIDALINEKAEGWNTQRMGKVDLTIIRLAVYEMLFDEDVPAKVAINEAVELAKKYGQDESPSFVNGVLAKFAE